MSLLDSIFSGKDDTSLDKSLAASKKSFFSKLGTALAGKSKVDAEVLDDLEEVLISADVGVPTTLKIIEAIEERVARDKYLGASELGQILKEEMYGILTQQEKGKFSFDHSAS